MATSTTNRKLGKLYEGLSERERARMMAKLAREHKPDEMNRLRDATPPEHAETYNRTLKLLRTLNGSAIDWIGLSFLGMQRDRMRFQTFARDVALKDRLSLQFALMWRLLSYPVTESEHRAMVERNRSRLVMLDGYAEVLADFAGDEEGLHPEIAELLQSLPPELERERHDSDEWKRIEEIRNDATKRGELEDDIERSHKIAERIRGIMNAAIKRGELPKPKRKKGELWLPDGVLSDWAEGTTPDTYDIGGPGLNVPMLMPFLGELGATWDIRPDDEAEAVKERRKELYTCLPTPPDIGEELRKLVTTLEPPLTLQEWERDEERAQEIHDAWYSVSDIAEIMHEAATAHAEARSQLEGLAEALEIVRRDDFAGEDPLFPEIRAKLEEAQAEAERFPALWELANAAGLGLRDELYKLQGLEPPAWGSPDAAKPAPLPTVEPITDEMLQLIHGWGE